MDANLRTTKWHIINWYPTRLSDINVSCNKWLLSWMKRMAFFVVKFTSKVAISCLGLWNYKRIGNNESWCLYSGMFNRFPFMFLKNYQTKQSFPITKVFFFSLLFYILLSSSLHYTKGWIRRARSILCLRYLFSIKIFEWMQIPSTFKLKIIYVILMFFVV